MHLPNGHSLQSGKYRLSHVIGQGGFGITYQAHWNTELKGALGKFQTDVQVCIKEYFFKDYCYRDNKTSEVKVHSETGKLLFHKFKEKLIKEARILSDVHHPYIVHVLEVFEENNTAYIVMEYIAGYSLKQKMERGGALAEGLMLKYMHQIGEALAFVHEKNILHLDIKPSNILIDKNNNARLIDFGVSKRYDLDQQETSTTMLTLSKGFAAIEQYDDEGTLIFSPAPDIYSFGATMYNLLTGKIPIESILRATKELIIPSILNKEISPDVEAVILKAMAISPKDRYASMAEMLEKLPQPPKEVLESETNLLSSAEEEETTILTTALRNGDDATTILSGGSEPVVKKKRKTVLVALLVTGFMIIASAGVWLFSDQKPSVSLPEENISVVVEEREKAIAEEELTANGGEHISEELHTAPETAINTTENNPVEPVGRAQTINDTSSEVSSEAEERENEPLKLYEEFMLSGHAKRLSKDYTGALADFEKARDYHLTEDVVLLTIEMRTHIEEEEIAERRAQYEEKMPFGPYMIVKKKNNDRYGAIDEKGFEIIPCEYVIARIADSGRAFLREDDLYDIYDNNGNLMNKGVTSY